MPPQRCIKVKICEGLFETERLVTFEIKDGEESLFVPAQYVDEQQGVLYVDVLDENQEYLLVSINYVQGLLTVRVPRSIEV